MSQTFQRLAVAPAYQQVSETIEREILAGRIKPGDKLPTETALAVQMGVNRSTVREGIRLLEQSGLVRREGGKRLTASLPHYGELASRMSRAMVLHEVSFLELWEAAMALEPATARLAAPRIGPDLLAQLADNLARTEETLRKGRSVVELDIEFHALIAKAADNKALLLAREPTSLLFYPAVGVLLRKLPQAGKRLLDAHRQIVAGLERAHAETAESWMRKHIVDFKRGYAMAGIAMDRPVEQIAHDLSPRRRTPAA
ncbi:MAG: FadR family transcriptional regulator [Rhodospirillales bacterium]|nr:FadR family transcriptional regulator [Rhodospirillales bacterium]